MRRLSDRSTKKYFTFVFSINHRTEYIAHPVTGDHIAGKRCGALEIITCPSCHLIHEQLFGDTPAKKHRNHMQHTGAIHRIAIFRGQLHGDTKRTPARNDRNLVHRISFWEHACDDCVA